MVFFLCVILISLSINAYPIYGQSVEKDYQTYSGEHLKMLRIPIGGVGTGDILVGGRGDIQHIEVFNRPDRSRKLINTFFSIWIKKGENSSTAKILERELLPPYEEITHQYVYGLPRFRNATFTNNFPIPKWTFSDEDIPLNISMEAFNPYIPLDLKNSSFPIAAFYWSIQNPTNEEIEISISLNMENPIKAEKLVTEVIHNNQLKGLRFAAVEGMETNYNGAMIVSSTAPKKQVQTHWHDGRWRDDAHLFWKDFSDDGELTEVTESWSTSYKPVAYNEISRRNCSVLVNMKLKPGELTKIPFYISWYFPRREFTKAETFGIEEAAGQVFENYYFNNFSDELDVLHKFLSQEHELYVLTKKFASLIQTSSYPSYVKEALTTQASTIKTNLIQVTKEGDAHGFEGVLPTGWCCPGTCTHVWNYEQTLASLFPEIERSMRNIEFTHNTFDNGFQSHRSVIPLGDYWFNGPAAADGQMGSIVRAYREWKFSGDNDWLATIWPKVKKAIQFAWYGPGEIKKEKLKFQLSQQQPWDPKKTGILTGRQHNTYDISFFGPNSMTSSLYLAALKASGEMAKAMEDQAFSNELEKVYKSGKTIFEDSLWNGDYFIQIITGNSGTGNNSDFELSPAGSDGTSIPKYQYGDGCLADQLLGQYLAHVSGLGFILDSSKVDNAILQVYKNNFIRELRDFPNVQRVYALNDESGVILCSWPKGNRPLLPFVYADEIWSGVEYQVATSLIYSGYTNEGLEIVKAIQDRYDGYKRNPFEHNESGVHYARAMSSWSILLALSGVEYDGIAKTMKFNPQISERNLFTFWSTGSAWGSFKIHNNEADLNVVFGTLALKKLSLNRKINHITDIKGALIQENKIIFKEEIKIEEGDNLRLILK